MKEQNGTRQTKDGRSIYTKTWLPDKDPCANIILVHGIGEYCERYQHVAEFLTGIGCAVYGFDHIGHGKSEGKRGCMSYSDAFSIISTFKSELRKEFPEIPVIIYGHSMGGGVSACYLACYPDDFQKAILSSPMLELDSGAVPAFAAQFYAWFMIHTGKGRNYMPGAAPFRDVPDPESSCTSSEARYNYWFAIQRREPRYQMCVPAICTARQLLEITRFAGKAKNAGRINARILLFQAGKDTMVKNTGQDKFVRLLGGKARLVRFPQAKHEIYFEKDSILNDYWKEIEEFL